MRKMCPLFKNECLKKACAWYDENKNQCSVKS